MIQLDNGSPRDEARGVGRSPAAVSTAAVLFAAIASGAVLGFAAPGVGARFSGLIDVTLLALISLIFFDLRLGSVFRAFRNLRFLTIAWLSNFVVMPVIGFAIASLLLSGQPLLFAGLMIYFLAPCTDWFLGFTRLARGDTELGAALIPINIVTQLLLFPVWLWLFTRHTGAVDFTAIPGVLTEWFFVPLLLAQALRTALQRVIPAEIFDNLSSALSAVFPWVLAALVFQIFAANVGGVIGELHLFALIALAVFLFFAMTFIIGEIICKFFGFTRPQSTLLMMTMAARNAPLMLALTSVAIPDQPVVLAVIAFGMLIEIPHLTALRNIALIRNDRHGARQGIRRV